MPTRLLPPHPSLLQLKERAKDLLRAHRAGTMQAMQRIREFHPRYRDATDDQISRAVLKQSDALLAIAREYGFASWPRLKAFVDDPGDLALAHHLRIPDEAFRRAVELLDEGNVPELRRHLHARPALARTRAAFEGGNYFQNPALIEFVAENPSRNGRLPKNAADAARVVLDAGAKDDLAAVNSALDLVASSSVARESGVRSQLLDLLCEYGADPNAATHSAALYGEFDAVRQLIARGARVDLLVATALDMRAEAAAALPTASEELRQKALSLAAQYGYVEIVRLLIDAGTDPNRYAPVGGHSHATPLHQAALGGHGDVVRLLVERGARTDIRDIHHNGTPLDWARYAKQTAIAEYLRSVTPA